MWAAVIAALVIWCKLIEAAEDVYFGALQSVAIHGKWQGRKPPAHEVQYNILLRNGELRRLLFPKSPARLPRTGSVVMVKTLPLERCQKGLSAGSKALCVGSLMAQEEAPIDSYAPGQPRGPVSLKALIMQLEVCGQGPASDYETIMKTLWSDHEGHHATTVQSMFDGCSHHNANFTQQLGSKVLQVTVPIPCTGTTPLGAKYNGMECPFNEFSDVANKYVEEQLKINLTDYKYKVYIVPKGDLCNWGGMGYVGCVDDCRAWISGDLVEEPVAWMHEIGHNLYLNHAGKQGDEGYGDLSGIMGFCCDLRCYNTPHSFQLGWVKPIATLHQDNFPAGWWWTYKVPASVVAPENFIRIRPDWTPRGAATNMFISYRKTVGLDAGLDVAGGFGDKVIVYSSPAGDTQPFTSWEMSLTAGQMWREGRLGSNLVIRVFNYDGDIAVVGVCRPEEDKETACGDQKDNDCDTLIDDADPDCKASPHTRRLTEWWRL